MQISTNTTLIHGKQGAGKTLFAVLLTCDYYSNRIFGNVNIQRSGVEVVNRIDEVEMLKNFKYVPVPGVCIFDEMGLNFNSKNHSSQKNQDLSSFFFLVRKYNLSSIFISQRFGSIPVDMRELVDNIFELNVKHRKGQHPIFNITRQTLDGEGNLVFEEEYQFDIISYLQYRGVSYNTLESSIIT